MASMTIPRLSEVVVIVVVPVLVPLFRVSYSGSLGPGSEVQETPYKRRTSSMVEYNP